MLEYTKVETPDDFPAMCVCGSQKPPLVDTHLVKNAYGHVYLCRLCTMRCARALGLVKGDEQTRLQNAADDLAQADREIATRQAQLDRQAQTLADFERRVELQAELVEQLQGDLKLARYGLKQIADMAAA